MAISARQPPIHPLEELPRPAGRPSVTIGNFDGVHRGHQRVLSALLLSARRRGQASVVLTFEPHPGRVLHPDRPLPEITTPGQKDELLRRAGVDQVIFLQFTPRLAALAPEQFIEQVLREALNAGEIVTTPTFRFGHDRRGDPELLRRSGAGGGFETLLVEEIGAGGGPISSTRIRQALRHGDLELAAELLGRPYAVEGVVVAGAGRGSTLGFPTANLNSDNELFLARGVYLVEVRGAGLQRHGLANLGVRPTFGGDQLTLEVHLLDYSGDLRGLRLEVGFLQRLRDERRFSGPAALEAQIRADVLGARSLLESRLAVPR
jgi:riboflavin kinase/FMN adenylyltransferase